jgi:hypothetical protein
MTLVKNDHYDEAVSVESGSEEDDQGRERDLRKSVVEERPQSRRAARPTRGESIVPQAAVDSEDLEASPH